MAAINTQLGAQCRTLNNLPRCSLAVLIALLFLVVTPALAVTYSDNADGSVTDPTTELTWMRCSLGQTWTGGTCNGTASTYTWYEAVALTVTFAGQNDWRLPTFAELQGIVDTAYFPSIDPTAFPNTPASYFWSASVFADDSTFVWFVFFGSGDAYLGGKNGGYQVRLVRTGQPLGSFTETTTTTSSTTTTTVTSASRMLNFVAGWNLVGNGSTGSLDVVAALGDTNKVSTVWKWVANGAKWAFYAPSLVGQALIDYATGKGYSVLTAINGGEGFWVNAKQAGSVNLPSGNSISTTTVGSTLINGWNLVSVGDAPIPKQFCDTRSGAVTTLWAWDSGQATWYFYAPSLDNAGNLSSYVTSKGYLNFGTNTLDPTTGFWVNRP